MHKDKREISKGIIEATIDNNNRHSVSAYDYLLYLLRRYTMEKFFKGDTVTRVKNDTYEAFCKTMSFYGIDPDQEFIVANVFYNGCLADFYGVPCSTGWDAFDFELVIDEDIFMSADEFYADQNDPFPFIKRELLEAPKETPKETPIEATIEEKKASENQVGGSHYLEMGISPLDYTYAMYGYEGLKASITTKVLKYLGRNKDNEVEDLEKAKHCIELLIEKAKEVK